MASPEPGEMVTIDELVDGGLPDGDRGRFDGGVLGAGSFNSGCRSFQGYTTSRSRACLHDPNMKPQTVFSETTWRRIMQAIPAGKPWMNHGDGLVEDKSCRRDLEENHGRGIMEEES